MHCHYIFILHNKKLFIQFYFTKESTIKLDISAIIH